MKYNLLRFQTSGRLIIFFNKHDYQVSTSLMKENKRYKRLKTAKWISIRKLVPGLLLTVRSAGRCVTVTEHCFILAASACVTFKHCDWMNLCAASLGVDSCDKWKRAFRAAHKQLTTKLTTQWTVKNHKLPGILTVTCVGGVFSTLFSVVSAASYRCYCEQKISKFNIF